MGIFLSGSSEFLPDAAVLEMEFLGQSTVSILRVLPTCGLIVEGLGGAILPSAQVRLCLLFPSPQGLTAVARFPFVPSRRVT